MRRTLARSALLFSTAVVGSMAWSASMAAQESTTRGFVVGAHLGGATLEVENEDRREAGGAGLIFGYGLNRSFEIFLQLDGSEFEVENTDVDGTWTMGHVDLGLRYHFANSLRSWIPYVQGAFTGRGVSVEDAVVQGNPAADVSFLGGGFTVGGGILFYFTETVAADIQLAFTGGEFTEIKVNNVTVNGLEVDATSTRFDIGVEWWP
jgi:Outer membrane protein beta-barrel domain